MPSPGISPAPAGSATDFTIQIFNALLGPGWDNFNPGITDSVVLTVFREVNTVALTVVTVMFSWTMIQGVMGTAYDGEPMGKRLSTIWTPLRAVFAMGSLTPIIPIGVGGLSLIQCAILSAVSWSIYFANDLYSVILDGMAKTGGKIVIEGTWNAKENALNIVRDPMKALVAQQIYIQKQGAGIPDGAYTVIKTVSAPLTTGATSKYLSGDTGKQGAVYEFRFEGPQGSADHGDYGFNPGDFGSLKVVCVEDNDLCTMRANAVGIYINSLYKVAADYVSSGTMDLNQIYAAAGAYGQAMGTVAMSPDTVDAKLKADTASFVTQAKRDGWISAGMFYLTMARLNELANKQADSKIISSSVTRNVGKGSVVEDMGKVLAGVDSVLDLTRRSQEAAKAGTAPDDGIWGKIYSWFAFDPARTTWIMNQFGADGSDPLLSMASFGHTLISIGEGAYAAALLAVGAAETAAHAADKSLVGKVANLISGVPAFLHGFKAMLIAAFPMLDNGVIALFILGWFLAFYVPALPFVLFTSSVVGWFILVIESLCAAPLWAGAHAQSGGEDGLAQHAKQGYMLLLNIVMRPWLALIGLFLGFWGMKMVGWLLSTSFSVFATGLIGDAVSGLGTYLALSILYAIIIVIMSHKTFSLIHHLPDKVCTWIGAGVTSLGEHEMESRTRGGFLAVGNTGQQGARGAVGGLVQSAGKVAHRPSGGGPSTSQLVDTEGITLKD